MVDWDDVKENGWVSRHGKNLRILSIDGGGIRGLFSARYLAHLENHLKIRACEFFDMIVGTSTGSIIALALSIGIPASDIADLYKTEASSIFSKQRFSFRGILRNRYTSEYLKGLLQRTFNSTLMQDALTMLAIPAVEHSKAEPKVFKTPHHKRFFQDATVPMWKVALASSSAPTYFPAIETVGGDCKIDGGLWANNPVLVGIAEARIMGYGLEALRVLSIGTGKHIYNVSNRIAKKSGLIGYRTRIVDLTMQVQTASASYLATHILRDNMVRIDCTTAQKISLDSTDPFELEHLEYEAYKACGSQMEKVKKLFAI